MNALQEYFDQNGVTRYQVAKQTGIANTTLANAVKETKPLYPGKPSKSLPRLHRPWVRRQAKFLMI